MTIRTSQEVPSRAVGGEGTRQHAGKRGDGKRRPERSPLRQPTSLVIRKSGFISKLLIDGTKPLDAVVFLDVDDFFGGGDGIDGHVVVAAIFEDDETAVNAIEEQVQGQVAVGHGDDGVDGVGIAAANQIAELLVDAFNSFCRC